MDARYLPQCDDEDGLLTHIIEECAEVIKAVTKIQRFGIDNAYPPDGPTNKDKLLTELADLDNAVNRAKTFLGLREEK